MNSTAKAKQNQNIQVYVRCRPTNERERYIHSQEMVKVQTDREVVVKHMMDKMTKKFTFDRTFGPDSKQADVYQVVVAPLIKEVLAGYNCTVFAYGQTGTGKTHTMIGDETPQTNSSWEDSSDVGIIPRALSHLFEELRLMEVEFSMRISYLELYNEELSDLLSSSDYTQIRIFDDANKKGSIIVQGLEEIPVHSTADVYKLLAKGQEKRKTAPTLMNAQSSRSHTIFSILVHIKENGIDGEELLKIGKLNLVDLAGSENITKSGNEKGIRTRETVNINQSLLTLGRVITALVERTPHIPYRESKLTRLLQESLGGRTKTSIIATISPGHKDLEETISTLEYAHRAKNIQNKPELNQKLTKKTVLKEYTEEIDRLKRDLMAARDKNGVYLAEETYNDMQYQLESHNKELSEKIMAIKALKDELVKKQELFNEVSLHLVERTKELQNTENVLGETKKVLHKTKRSYQEKKHILMRHIRTEEILTGQAKELISVADTASKDSNKLHESIARRTANEIKNEEACRKLDITMSEHLNNMTINLNTFTGDFQQQAKSIIEHMTENMNKSKSLCENSIANLRLLIECEQQGKTDIETCILKQKSDFVALFGKHTEQNRNTLKITMEAKAAFDTQLNALQSDLTEKFSNFERDHSRLLELLKHNTNTVKTFCHEHTENLQTFTVDVVHSLKTNQQIIEQTTASNVDLTNKFKSLLEQMNELLIQSKANTEIISKVAPALKSVESRVEEQLNEDVRAIVNFSNQYHEQVDNFTTTINACDQSVKTIDKNSREIVRINREKDNEFAGNMQTMSADLTKQNNDLNAQLDVMINDISAINETTVINIDAGLNALINEVSNEQDRIDHCHMETVEIHNNLEATQKDYDEKLAGDIAVCMSRLDNFQKNEIKLYTPTGQTPSKRDYKYPKVLAMTSPHAKIIHEFWNNHDGSVLDCSAVIAEQNENGPLNESEGDENKSASSSSISLSTTPLTTTTTTDFPDRTLRDCRNINANSTPIVGIDVRKARGDMDSLMQVSALNEVSLGDKENATHS